MANSVEKQIHGVAVCVRGIGVLMIGDSRAGKSSTAIELLSKGSRLIADDAVIIVSGLNGELTAKPHKAVSGLIEIRDCGIVRVSDWFGISAIEKQVVISFFVEIVRNGDIDSHAVRCVAPANKEIAGVRIDGYRISGSSPVRIARFIESKAGMFQDSTSVRRIQSPGVYVQDF